jgi:glutathione peroxidase
MSLYDLSMVGLDGTPFQASDLQGKVVLFVNVASKCGFTNQYTGLQGLHERFSEQGLVMVGVPCNQFGRQEPGGPEEIVSFCQATYGVTFPLLEKQDVNGKNRSPLYQVLIGSEVGGDKSVKWNFAKFLVGKDGQVKARFPSTTKPMDVALVGAIETALAE